MLNLKDKEIGDYAEKIIRLQTAKTENIIAEMVFEKHFDPKLSDIGNEKNRINENISKLRSSLDAPPDLFIICKGEELGKYDTFIDSAIHELIISYKKVRRSIRGAHSLSISINTTERFTKNEEYKNFIIPLLKDQFWDNIEVSYIRLSSFWDRIGQLLDYIYFNIRNYDNDGFIAVIDRIHRNIRQIYPEFSSMKEWGNLWDYSRSEKKDGLKWLLKRRNVLIHSLSLKELLVEEEDEILFEANYNHLDEKIKAKLKQGDSEDELNNIHIHFKMITQLFNDCIEISKWGVKNVLKKEN